MDDHALAQKAVEATQSQWLVAAQQDFAALREIPNTRVKAWLAYLETLSSTERDRLIEVSALVGARCLRPASPLGTPETATAEWKRHQDAIQQFSAGAWWDYIGIRELRRAVAAAKAGMTSIVVPPEIAAAAEATTLPKAPALRRSVATEVAAPLGLTPRNQGGGDWDYLPSTGDSLCPFLHVDYGGMWAQLRYEVSWPTPNEPVTRRRISYERMLGIAVGDWDLIDSSNCGRAMTALRHLTLTLFTVAHDLGLCSHPLRSDA